MDVYLLGGYWLLWVRGDWLLLACGFGIDRFVGFRLFGLVSGFGYVYVEFVDCVICFVFGVALVVFAWVCLRGWFGRYADRCWFGYCWFGWFCLVFCCLLMSCVGWF